jgi:hypothetical protein
LPDQEWEAIIRRFFTIPAAGLFLVGGLLLAGCADGDPGNIGRYYSCNDWMRAHQAPGRERGRTSDQSSAPAGVLEDWLVERALDRGYEVTDAPVAGKVVTEAALIEGVTAQCAGDRVVQTLEGAITAVLDRLDTAAPAR